MIEWSLIKKMKSNPKILNVDMDLDIPLINEIRRRLFWLPEEDNDE